MTTRKKLQSIFVSLENADSTATEITTAVAADINAVAAADESVKAIATATVPALDPSQDATFKQADANPGELKEAPKLEDTPPPVEDPAEAAKETLGADGQFQAEVKDGADIAKSEGADVSTATATKTTASTENATQSTIEGTDGTIELTPVPPVVADPAAPTEATPPATKPIGEGVVDVIVETAEKLVPLENNVALENADTVEGNDGTIELTPVPPVVADPAAPTEATPPATKPVGEGVVDVIVETEEKLIPLENNVALEDLTDGELNEVIATKALDSVEVQQELENNIEAHDTIVSAAAEVDSLAAAAAEGGVTSATDPMLAIGQEILFEKLGLESSAMSLEELRVSLEAAEVNGAEAVFKSAKKSIEFIEAAYPVILQKAKNLKAKLNSAEFRDDSTFGTSRNLSVHGDVSPKAIIGGLKAAQKGVDSVYNKYLGAAENFLTTAIVELLDTSRTPGWSLIKHWLLGWSPLSTAIRGYVYLNRLKTKLKANSDTMRSAVNGVPTATGELTVTANSDGSVEVKKENSKAKVNFQGLTKAEAVAIVDAVISICETGLKDIAGNKSNVTKLKSALGNAWKEDRANNTGIIKMLTRLNRFLSTGVGKIFFVGRLWQPLVYGHFAYKSMQDALRYVESAIKE